MSALDEFPREVSLSQRQGRWRLSIHGPFVSGFAESHDREYLLPIAEVYAELRRSEKAGEPA